MSDVGARLACALLALLGAAMPARRAVAGELSAAAVQELRDRGVVFHDGKGHYLAIVVELEGRARKANPRASIFYGDARSMKGVHFGTSWGRATFDDEATTIRGQWEFDDPRYVTRSRLRFARAGLTVRCGSDQTKQFEQLSNAGARKLLAKVAVDASWSWRRDPYLLARDDGGTYYFVDRPLVPANNRDFRVLAGKRGAMSVLKVNELVSDASGDVFVTAAGTLRQPAPRRAGDPPAPTWTPAPRKNKATRQELVAVSVDDRELVYGDLGVYVGQPFGTPCDDL